MTFHSCTCYDLPTDFSNWGTKRTQELCYRRLFWLLKNYHLFFILWFVCLRGGCRFSHVAWCFRSWSGCGVGGAHPGASGLTLYIYAIAIILKLRAAVLFFGNLFSTYVEDNDEKTKLWLFNNSSDKHRSKFAWKLSEVTSHSFFCLWCSFLLTFCVCAPSFLIFLIRFNSLPQTGRNKYFCEKI